MIKVDVLVITTDNNRDFAEAVFRRNLQHFPFTGQQFLIAESSYLTAKQGWRSCDCDSFGEKIEFGIENSATEFVLLMLDDFLILSLDWSSELSHILAQLDPSYFRLNSNPPNGASLSGYTGIVVTSLHDKYQINTQPSIWKKTLLSKLLDKELTPWLLETEYAEKYNAEIGLTLSCSKNVVESVELIKKGRVKRSLCWIYGVDTHGLPTMGLPQDLFSSFRGGINRLLFKLGVL